MRHLGSAAFFLLALSALWACDRSPDTNADDASQRGKAAQKSTPTPSAGEEPQICADAYSVAYTRSGTCYTINATFCGTQSEEASFRRGYQNAEAALKNAGFKVLSEVDIPLLCRNCRRLTECPSYYDASKAPRAAN